MASNSRMVNQLVRRATTAVAVLAMVAGVSAAQDNAADAARLVEVLGIRSGSIVADIGAGDAALTIPIAKTVGATGRVYATELPGTSVERLRKVLAKADSASVEIVEGDAKRTNLPADCCDAIFIRNVYHHFAEPAAMNESLRQSLKPGGKLAIMDFAPDGPEAKSAPDRAGGKTHGVTAQTVKRELQEAGFEPVLTEQRHNKTFLVVVHKPDR